jgi:hypothetical protein
MERLAAPLLSALLLASAANAGAADVVPPDVVSVATGGYWEDAERRGTFRVTVRNVGFEHVSSSVLAEWIADPPTASDGSRSTRSHQLVAPGLFSFSPPIIERISNAARITLSGVNSHDPAQAVKCVFELFPDGTVRVLQACH